MTPAFAVKNGILHVEDIPLPEIAQTYGTPTYVYSAAEITRQFTALKDAMMDIMPAGREPMFCYACKACSTLGIMALLRSLGSALEVVSEGELRRGLAAGFTGSQIVNTGVGKTRSEIAFSLKAGIHQFNIESLPELEHIQSVAQELDLKATVAFRLNPNIANAAFSDKTSTGGKKDKFGISYAAVYEGYARAQQLSHVEAVGISMHIGSQISRVEKFKDAFEKIPELVTDLRRKGYTVERLDIGGGFPIVYKDEPLLDLTTYAQWVRDFIVPLETQIILEPGRFYVGNAAVLLTRVIYEKVTEERNFLILDAAMNDLIRPSMYDAWHGIEAVENRDAPQTLYDVVGPVCESGDTFAKDRPLPRMAHDDLAVITSAGAYGASMASNYNTRPLPAEILVKGNAATILRTRQSYDAIMKDDIIPDWL